MSVMPGFDGFIRSLETIVDDLVVESVKRELHTSAEQLASGRFQNLAVPESVFGGSPHGSELGFHHGRAHQVIAETLDGVISDLRDFREGVVKAEQMLEGADGGAATDLERGRSALEMIENANRSFDGDRRYDHARNDLAGED